MSETSLSPKRPRLDFDETSSKHEPFDKYKNRDRDRDQDEQSNYSHSHSKHRKRQEPTPVEEEDGKDDEGKVKNNSGDTARREHTLVIRLANKEQELQDCMNQIQEMKQAQTQNTAQLRSMLLDPAINLVFQRMAKEMDDHKDKLKQKQNELTAWKFTPDSQTGMRVMARCRMLLTENQELGKMISSGRTAKLEGEIVLQKALVTEMKKNQKELDEFVGELEEDVEGMQGMIFMLRQQLKEAQEQIVLLQAENGQLRTLQVPPDPEPGGKNQSVNGAQSSNSSGLLGNQRTTPSALVTPSQHSSNHFLTVNAQHSEEEFVESKVTPDSGVHTQEEDEDMDTTDSAAAPPQQCDHSDKSTAQCSDQKENAALTSQAPSNIQHLVNDIKLEYKDDEHTLTTTSVVSNNNYPKTDCSNHELSSTNVLNSQTEASTGSGQHTSSIEGHHPGLSVEERTQQSLPLQSNCEIGEDRTRTQPTEDDQNSLKDDKSRLKSLSEVGLNSRLEDVDLENQSPLTLLNGIKPHDST